MTQRANRRVLAAAAATALVGAGLAVVLPSGGADAAGSTAVTRTVKRVAHGYLTTYKVAGGGTTMIFDARGPVIIRSPKMTKARATTMATGATVYSAEADIVTAQPISAAAKNTALPPSFPSELASLEAVGVSPAEAQSLTTAEAQVAGPMASPTIKQAAGTRAAAYSTWTGKQLWDRTCASSYFDGTTGHLYGCYNQYVVQKSGASLADWEMMDQFYMSATKHGGVSLTGLKQGVGYHGTNQLVDWKPRYTYPKGECQTRTEQIGLNATFVNVTYQTCNEQAGLYYNSQWTFETKWDGKGDGPTNGARDTGGVDRYHNPPSASPSRDIIWKVWWE